ncbi:unnamed protein product [Cunninghamella echinulata]
MKTQCNCQVCPRLYAQYHQQQQQKENEKCTSYDDVYMADGTHEMSEYPRGKKRKLANDTNIKNHDHHDKHHQNYNNNNNDNNNNNNQIIPNTNTNEIQNAIEKFTFSFN